jgi:hypothetical protein
MTFPPPPIDWDASYGTDWVGVQASLVYAPTFAHARFEVQRRPLAMPAAIKKTALWAEVPFVMPKNARESLTAILHILEQAERDYWIRYLREKG